MENNAIISMEVCINPVVNFYTKCNYRKEKDVHIVKFILYDTALEKINYCLILKDQKLFSFKTHNIPTFWWMKDIKPLKVDEVEVIDNNAEFLNLIDLPIETLDMKILNSFLEIKPSDDELKFKIRGVHNEIIFDINLKIYSFK